MGGFLTYLKRNPWQRRALTLSATLVLALLAAMLLYRPVRDRLVIDRLGASDPQTRAEAIARAHALAARRPAFLRLCIDSLDTAEDRAFAGLMAVLQGAGKFAHPPVPARHLDRGWYVLYRSSLLPEAPAEMAKSREIMLTRLLLGGRANRWVRRAAAEAAEDPSPLVRQRATVLIASLGDADRLGPLLTDEDANVAAMAACCAGIAGLDSLTAPIADLLAGSETPITAGAAGWALGKLDPNAADALLAERLAGAPAGAMRETLLDAAASSAGRRTADAVLSLLSASADDANALPSAMALVAGRKLDMHQAGTAGAGVLEAIGAGRDVTVGQAIAAVQAIRAAGTAAREPLLAVLADQWPAGPPLLLVELARAAGEQTSLSPGAADANAPGDANLIETLRLAALSGPAEGPAPAGLPLARSAAATAMWLARPTASFIEAPNEDPNLADFLNGGFDPTASAFAVHEAARGPGTLAGDYLAWHIGRSGRAEAFALGQTLLPALDAPVWDKVTDPNIRSAGAMLLAVAAEGAAQRAAAAGRVTERLVGGDLGGELDPYVRGAYKCALYALGDDAYRRDVIELLRIPEFPQRRAFTALALRGDRAALQWWLEDLLDWPADTVLLYVHTQLGEVLAAAAPEMPTIDQAADEELRLYQAKRLRAYYLLKRGSLSFGLGR